MKKKMFINMNGWPKDYSIEKIDADIDYQIILDGFYFKPNEDIPMEDVNYSHQQLKS